MARFGLLLALIALVASANLAFGQSADTTRVPKTSCTGAASSDTTIYDLKHVSEAPVARHIDPLPVREHTVLRGGPRSVLLEFVVNADGTVAPGSVVVVEPSKMGLDAAAVQVVKQASFWPGCRFEDAVRVRVRLRLDWAGRVIIR